MNYGQKCMKNDAAGMKDGKKTGRVEPISEFNTHFHKYVVESCVFVEVAGA